MVTKNNHALGLFNGDIGIMWQTEKGALDVCFLQATEVRKVDAGLLKT